MHRDRNEYEAAAEAEYNEALAIRRELAAKNPQAFDINVAQTLYNFAFFYQAINKPRKMRESLEEAAQILEKYNEGVPYIRKYLEVVREELEKLENTAE